MSAAGTTEDRELKARHKKMWALGDYPAMARDFVDSLGPIIVEAAAIRAGQTVLDVGAGTGNASIPAAKTGAQVTASDLTPELLADGRARAAEAGVELQWDEADAEALPYESASYDVVMSCIGAMFAPHHEAVADELVRVAKPGGTIAMLNWTPEGLIGDIFATMKPFAPPPPPGATPPPRWGSEEHVKELFGDRVTDLHMGRHMMPVEMFATPAEFAAYFKAMYGPTIVAYKNATAQGREDELDQALLELMERRNLAAPGEPARFEQEYLLLVGRKA